jgi:hypothetical protein
MHKLTLNPDIVSNQNAPTFVRAGFLISERAAAPAGGTNVTEARQSALAG